MIKRKVDALISGKSTSFKLHESITSEDFAVLKEMTNLRSNYDITQHGVNVIFSYLMMGGYLTFSDSMKRTFKLPNHEIRHEFQAKMLEYYHAKYKLDEDDFKEVTNALGEIFCHVGDSQYKDSLSKFKEEFSILLKKLPEFKSMDGDSMSDESKGDSIHGNEDVVHCLLSYLSLQLHDVTHFGSEISLGDGRADIAFTNREKSVGAIIEIKYTKDSSSVDRMAKEGLEQIEVKDYAREMQRYYDIVLLGIGISEEKAVAIQDKVVEMDDSPKPKVLPWVLDNNLA